MKAKYTGVAKIGSVKVGIAIIVEEYSMRPPLDYLRCLVYNIRY